MKKKERFTDECVAHNLKPSTVDEKKSFSSWSWNECIKKDCKLYRKCAVYENWGSMI